MSSSTVNNHGIGFVGLLTVLFVGLKLTGYIGWSWWWVLSPIWISWSVVIVILAVVALAAILRDQHDSKREG